MLCETGSIKDLEKEGRAAEEKLDGTRALIIKDKGEVTIQNRDGIDYSHRLPELTGAAKIIKGDYIIDGEIVYVNPATGRVEFTPCQRRCSTTDLGMVYFLKAKYPVRYAVFDVLKVGSKIVVDEPYLRRKELLRSLVPPRDDFMKYVTYRFDLRQAWEEVLQRGDEGLVLKDVNSKYVHRRSYSWLKLKNWREAVYDVVGYTEGKGLRSLRFGALVLAENGVYRGLVGSGPNEAEMSMI
jgi:bifunctional non-homologous end joining protein LigD